VQEYTNQADVDVPADANLTDMLWNNATNHPATVVFSKRHGDTWTDVTAAEFAQQVKEVAGGLLAAGVQLGDRVAIMSKTRYEWGVADFAIWAVGGVGVPIYETSSAEQVQWILSDSEAVAIFVESAKHAGIVADVQSATPACRNVWQIEGGDLVTLAQQGSGTTDEQLAARHRTLTSDTLATIIYTSGTTGRPKGCELTHGNFLFDVYSVSQGAAHDFLNEQGSTLLFLPLAHVFGRVIQLACFHNRARVGHTADIKNLVADLGVFKPTFLLAVPRIFEKVYNASKQKAHAAGKGSIFDKAEHVAISYSEALDSGGAGLALRAQHALFDKLVYSKLRAALGGRVEYCVSGSAPLGARLGHFFRGIGITILEGYGLTESSAGAALNFPKSLRIGSVGRPVPGASARIAANGEILLKGPHIFRGYYKNPAATREVFTDDGWFRSGDIGELDADGYLRITGRLKEIIVTAGGKNVAPAVLEDRLRAHPLVSQCLVVGDQKPFISCLVTIDADAFPAWVKAHEKPEGSTVADLVDDEDLRAEIQAAVDEANKAVSQAESIRSFRILPVDFTEEAGQMTPSLKLKRNVVMKDFASAVDEIYG
jgi:long-chain acyl-CoA synthetase